MKKLIYILFACVLMVSCELETSGNKEFDGFWQLRQVDTLETGGTKDMRESNIYWSVQGKLLEVRHVVNEEHEGDGFLFRFQRDGSSLILSSPYRHYRHDPDEPVEDVEILKPYGIFHLEEAFYIETLNDDDMVLNNDVLRLYFRKY